MQLEHRLSTLLQLHLPFRLTIWLQWIGQRQLQDETGNNYILDFGVSYIKVIHKEYSRFLNQFFPTPCSYHELNMIIYTSYINI